MGRDDALLAFERHATSKIQEATDLQEVQSLGFRGEALASIAAVAKVELKTIPRHAEVGTRVTLHGGTLRDVRECTGAAGTDITVARLFYNTPARRKFLRQPSTELRRIRQWLQNSALGHPEVRYRLFADGKEVLNLARRGARVDRGRDLWRGNLVEVDTQEAGIAIEGLLGHPSLARADQAGFVVLVNRRPVSDSMVVRAVREGFLSTLKDREYPRGFLHIEIPPQEVDVNVHPQKSEVRFSDGRTMYRIVRDATAHAVQTFNTPLEAAVPSGLAGNVSHQGGGSSSPEKSGPMHALMSTSAAGRAPIAATVTTERGATGGMSSGMFDGAAARSVTPGASSIPAAHVPTIAPQGSQKAEITPVQQTSLFAMASPGEVNTTAPGEFRFSDLRYLAQLFECYLLCELGDEFVVVDMHAAHERYNYNLVRNRFAKEELSSQGLLVPLTVTLSEDEVHHCSKHQDLLRRFGFEVEVFGATDIIVRAVPPLLSGARVTQVIKEIAVCLFEEMAEDRLREFVDHVAARIACHASIRAGKRIKREEVYALFQSLDATEFRSACPHGRPIVVTFTRAAVERWFGRDR